MATPTIFSIARVRNWLRRLISSMQALGARMSSAPLSIRILALSGNSRSKQIIASPRTLPQSRFRLAYWKAVTGGQIKLAVEVAGVDLRISPHDLPTTVDQRNRVPWPASPALQICQRDSHLQLAGRPAKTREKGVVRTNSLGLPLLEFLLSGLWRSPAIPPAVGRPPAIAGILWLWPKGIPDVPDLREERDVRAHRLRAGKMPRPSGRLQPGRCHRRASAITPRSTAYETVLLGADLLVELGWALSAHAEEREPAPALPAHRRGGRCRAQQEGGGGAVHADQANWTTSVEPSRAVVEDWPPAITCATWSK